MARITHLLESLTVNLSADLVAYRVQVDEPAAMLKLLRSYAPAW